MFLSFQITQKIAKGISLIDCLSFQMSFYAQNFSLVLLAMTQLRPNSCKQKTRDGEHMDTKGGCGFMTPHPLYTNNNHASGFYVQGKNAFSCRLPCEKATLGVVSSRSVLLGIFTNYLSSSQVQVEWLDRKNATGTKATLVHLQHLQIPPPERGKWRVMYNHQSSSRLNSWSAQLPFHPYHWIMVWMWNPKKV